MKKYFPVLGFCFILVFTMLSCDSLWKVGDTSSIAFKLDLPELIGSDIKKNSEPALISVTPDITTEDDIKVQVSLHNALNDAIVSTKTLSLEEAESSNIVFSDIKNNQTLYAKVEVLLDDVLYFRARSFDTIIKTGENILSVSPNAMFITESGLYIARGTDTPIHSFDSGVIANLSALTKAYEEMTIGGTLIPNATVFADVTLPVEAQGKAEDWNFPGLIVTQGSGLRGEALVRVEDGGILNIYSVSLKKNALENDFSNSPLLLMSEGGEINLQGDIYIDSLQYDPSESTINVKGDLTPASRIVLNINDTPDDDTILVKKDGGNFIPENFILPTGITAVPDSAGNLVIPEDDDTPDENIYTVTFDANGGAVSVESVQINENNTIVLPENPTRDGYDFDGWFFKDDTTKQLTEHTLITEDITVVAKWTKLFTIRFELNGGIGDAPNIIVREGEKATNITTPKFDGHIFKGWFTNDNTEFTADTIVAKDMTVTAIWEAVSEDEAVVTYNANGGTVSPASEKVTKGSSVTNLPTPDRTGYTFGGWYTDDNFSTEFTTLTIINENIEVFAKWTINRYTITYNANGGVVSPESETVDYNTTITSLPTPTRELHRFEGWFTDKDIYNNAFTTSTPVTDDTEVFAKWTSLLTYTFNGSSNSYSITDVDASLSGEVTIPSMYDGPDGNFSVTAIINSAFEGRANITSVVIPNTVLSIGISSFEGCTSLEEVVIPGSVINIGSYVFRNSNPSLTVYAEAESVQSGWAPSWDEGIGEIFWKCMGKNPAIYTVSFDATGGTPTPPSIENVYHGRTITLPPNPAFVGYTFEGWFFDNNTFLQPVDETTPIQSTVTVYAHWVADSSGSGSEVFLNVKGAISGANGTESNPYTTFGDAKGALPNGGTIWVMENPIEISGSPVVWESSVGAPITLKRKEGYQAELIILNGSDHLTLQNITLDGNVNITNATDSLIAVNGGELILNDGAVLQNNIVTAYNISGAGIVVSSATAKLTMNGGIIKNNKTSTHGGGVAVSSGTFVMTGGEITLNTATKKGGGVYISGSTGSFTMKMSEDGTKTNGFIRNNTANENGGGIFVNVDATLNLQEAPTISENKVGGTVSNGALSGGDANNIAYEYNSENSRGNFYITGALTGSSNTIYITPHDTLNGTVVASADNASFIQDGLLFQVTGDKHVILWGDGTNIIVSN